MANKILVAESDGTPKQLVFGDIAGDFSPTAANDLRDAVAGNRTTVQLILAALAAGRQSTKFDFGADRARSYNIRAALEFAATPTAGAVVELYLAPSQSATAGTANPGGATGADSAYAGYSANLAASVLQLLPIGVFTPTAQATATVQIAECGVFSPPERYGSLIVVCTSSNDLFSDDVESHIVFDPIVEEVQ